MKFFQFRRQKLKASKLKQNITSSIKFFTCSFDSMNISHMLVEFQLASSKITSFHFTFFRLRSSIRMSFSMDFVLNLQFASKIAVVAWKSVFFPDMSQKGLLIVPLEITVFASKQWFSLRTIFEMSPENMTLD